MKDIPAIDLLRADFLELSREFNKCYAARMELRTALTAATRNASMLTELLAVLIHRGGEAGITLNHDERDAAFEACWLRVSIDVLEDDDPNVRNSVRVSLVPPTSDERKANEEAVKKSNEEAIRKVAENIDDKPEKFKLIDP